MTYAIAQNQPGPLPLKIPFKVPITGDVTLAFSGTCYTKFAAATGGVSVYLDDAKLGDVPLYFNNGSMHMTLPTAFFATNLGDGTHTITLTSLTNETASDKNDYYSLWIVD